MKFIVIVLFSLIAVNGFSQSNPDSLITNFLDSFQVSNGKALDALFKTNNLFGATQTNPLKLKLKELTRQLGKYCGYDIAQKIFAGSSMVQYYVIMKYENRPIKFLIILYKPREIWQLYNFEFNSDVDEDLKNSAKVSLFYKN